MTLPTTAGPELDLAVWRALWAKDREGDAYIETRPECLEPGQAPHLLVCWHLEGGSFEPWSPSTRIEHTFEVVERMLAYEPCIVWNDELHSWCVNFEKRPVGEQKIAKSLPLAICLAALEAVMRAR